MKNALLFAILLLSVTAFAQDKKQNNRLQHMVLYSTENFQQNIKHEGMESKGLYFKMKLGNPSEQQTPGKRLSDSMIPIFDSVYQWSWDTLSIGWTPGYKFINIVYNANNNITGYIMQIRNGNTWENSEKVNLTYNENNSITLELYQEWNGSTWVNYGKDTYTYDTHNNETSYLSQEWMSGAWENSYQSISAYDANNNLTSEYSQMWYSGAWENSIQSIYTYDANNNMTSSLIQFGFGATWENSYKITYTYDIYNKLTTELGQNWIGSDWMDFWQFFYTYNASNNLINVLEKNWNGSAWVNSSQTNSTYNANNKLITELSQSWTGSDWTNYAKVSYDYDANMNNTSVLYQNWTGSAWTNNSQDTYTFDIYNIIKSEVYKYFDMDGTTVMYGDSMYYYFSTVVTGIPDLIADIATVYPNPTNGKITISSKDIISSIEIYNLSGNRIYSDFKIKQQTSKEIDLTGFPKGTYFVKIYSETKSFIRKIIVQ
jgi:hypothetical protein